MSSQKEESFDAKFRPYFHKIVSMLKHAFWNVIAYVNLMEVLYCCKYFDVNLFIWLKCRCILLHGNLNKKWEG